MGFLLLVPFFLIRFRFMARLDPHAISRAAHFPPLHGAEKAAYWVYQLSTAAVLLFILFGRIETKPRVLFLPGLALYLIGLALLAASVAAFAAPSPHGLKRDGLYSVSRNPMYLAYFLVFLGCVFLTQSPPLAVSLAAFQGSAHWIILAEERWCVQKFGEEYLRYQAKVRRYF